jgi:hypothetical protein
VSVHQHQTDLAHHHPVVVRTGLGRWAWSCACGGASCRTSSEPRTWRQALIEALLHSATIAP